MKLSVPTVPVYYYEVSPRSQRLLYHVPRKMLPTLVRKRLVKKEALRDFPYGIEVDVSDSEYQLIRDDYGFEPPLSPRFIWMAFEGVLIHSRQHEVSENGLIDAQELEAYALTIARELDEWFANHHRQRIISPEKASRDQIQQVGRRNLLSVIEKRLIRENAPKGFNRELPIAQQKWCSVPMSPGVSAKTLFAAAQSSTKRG